MSFQREDTVLYFRPRAHARWRERRYVLWPAWAYRVVAPEVRERQLNVLQKAVLGMFRAGVTTPEGISTRLHLHADLMAFIAGEILEKGLIDHQGLPTKLGLEVLEQETLQSRRVVAGYVFQDPWTGELWPRFVERLQYAETEMKPNGYPNLVLGTTGKPEPRPAYLHRPERASTQATPDATDILEVTRRHGRALRHSDPSMEEEEEDGGTFELGTIDIERVSLIEDRPQPVYLATYLYLPEDADTAGDWHVCDPFGLGASTFLRRAIVRQMEQEPTLSKLVDQLLGRALGEGMEGVRAWMEQLRGKAELGVEQRLTSEIRRLPYYAHVLEMELAYLEVEHLGTGSSNPKLRGVLLTARRVTEALFAHLLGAHRSPDILRRISREPEHSASIYTSTAAALGLEVPLPQPLANVKRSQVESVLKHPDGWRLRPMIVATLLTARDDNRHPLREAARREPRLLNELELIASIAGRELHGGDGALSMTAVQETVNRVYHVVGLFSGLANGTRNPPLR
ncbi:hypothetical protein Q664_29365 [Archangium violaceum Cb vi76]|uniref:Uncharacterized protein n=1 Tax=Archangium violaceum Cb vi76 TaxID=1406225 RepID=A0A084SPD8_9BACT|nr:hypothetical protein Q664_29365 [Archangium violaceum Cb vi76]